MSPLMCFPNKLEGPGCGAGKDFGFEGNTSKPAEESATGERVASMGATCCTDPGNEAAGECGKRLSESLWASEDLGCSSQIRRDGEAAGGSPEWAGAVDSQRAISLDASGCLAELSKQSLVRSAALEDLTFIGGRSSWANQALEVICAQTNAALKSCIDAENKNISPENQQPLYSPNLPGSIFNSHSEDLHAARACRNISQEESLFIQMPSGSANSSGDSSLHTNSYSRPDISDDSVTRSSVVQTTSTAELQNTTPQSSPARKSLVPVAVFKGLCCCHAHQSRVLLSLTPPTSFFYNAASTVCHAALSLRVRVLSPDLTTPGEACCPRSPLSLLVPSLHLCSLCRSCSPKSHI